MSEQNPPAGGTTKKKEEADGDSDSEKRTRLRDFGPTWITAIAALITALTASASFFAGRATAPGASKEPSSATTQIAAPVTHSASTPVQSVEPSSSSAADQTNAGTVVKHCTVDVTRFYGIDVDRTPTCPRPASDRITTVQFPILSTLSSNRAEVALLGSDTPSYDACNKDTRYEDSVAVQVGSVVCVTAPGIVAGLKISNESTPQGSDGFVTVDLTVWNGPDN